MKQVKVEIEGTSPLLMNRFRDTQIEGKSTKRTASVTEQDYTDKLYVVNGKNQLPSVYLKSALVEAGKNFKIKGHGKSTYSKIMGSSIEINGEYNEIEGIFEPYRIAAVNPMTKGRMMVTRPRFNKWNVSFVVNIFDDDISLDVINELLTYAGKYVGVGDWRPAKKGMFGKFMITSFQEVK